MRILVASNNSHKIREFGDCLPGFTLVTPGEIGLDFDHDETATSFHGNALGKALALTHLALEKEVFAADMAVLADDSGICVHALGGAPGIYSARYGAVNGKNLESPERNELLLRAMAGTTDRRAMFVCALALVVEPERFYVAQETWKGQIATEASQARGGFGYDPIFWLPEHGCTVAELSAAQKAEHSHRGKAAKALMPLITSLKERT